MIETTLAVLLIVAVSFSLHRLAYRPGAAGRDGDEADEILIDPSTLV